ncbi:Animal haem peroxidase [Sphingomonas sp. OV641]|uniref:peroxidase family protein n=1 Tax=Sphingomonas sp. OV641 TaxID=1881068 RepID=UPI0008BB89B2|nr:heme peroxidase family protein [Sphingomonas sp. OV641]SEJ83390.1 Animal haem peroxidase [Sphingomonas sp. OV641]
MLFTLGHGQHVLIDTGAAPPGATGTAPNDVVPLDSVLEAEIGDTRSRLVPAAVGGGSFAFYFADAPALPEDPTLPDRLDDVAEAMVEAASDPEAQNSTIPPIFTYFGQFVDHDITANTDRESVLSQIDGVIIPVDRSDVVAGLFNLRDGSLQLDSIYGDTVGQGPFATKLAGLMRHPTSKAKMRLAIPVDTPGQVPPFPKGPDDNAADLLRLGFLIGRGDVKQADLDALPADLRETFVNPDGTPNLERAIIGDARNDENLLVAQLHMSMLRFHNKLVDATGSFDGARRLMRWHYQWLLVNQYLRTICDTAVVDDVVAREAPLYGEFFAAHGTAGSAQMPLPLEFSVAAFRFGHSMIRSAYDHNRFFGEAVPGDQNLLPEASFELLFAFTGNGKMNNQAPRLPRNWVIEWDRFVRTDPTKPMHAARRIDTHLAPPLADMNNEPTGVFKHLAKRNLRRGYRLSIPTAQACIASLAAGTHPGLTPLSRTELTSGDAGAALDAAGLADATPLWFYVLKEAEVRANGQHLGPLGSVLVAETLVGLVANDPTSFWRGGAGGSRWSPDAAGLAGGPIDSLEAMLRFAGML